MTEDQKRTIEWIANKLIYSVPATNVPDEQIQMPVGPSSEGEYKLWSGQMTTYTLGLMLSGVLLEAEKSAI